MSKEINKKQANDCTYLCRWTHFDVQEKELKQISDFFRCINVDFSLLSPVGIDVQVVFSSLNIFLSLNNDRVIGLIFEMRFIICQILITISKLNNDGLINVRHTLSIANLFLLTLELCNLVPRICCKLLWLLPCLLLKTSRNFLWGRRTYYLFLSFTSWIRLIGLFVKFVASSSHMHLIYSELTSTGLNRLIAHSVATFSVATVLVIFTHIIIISD